MTAEEWFRANPVTHTCRLRGGNIHPEQRRRRKEMAKEKSLAVRPNRHGYMGGFDDSEVLMSLRLCLKCQGPEEIRTATYRRLDTFRSGPPAKGPVTKRCAQCGAGFRHAASKLCPGCRAASRKGGGK